MAPTKPSDTSCKPTVASAGATSARGYRRVDAHQHQANLKQRNDDDDDTSSLSSSDTTHESTQPSPVAAAKMDDVDDADDGDMKPAAKDDDEVGGEGEVQIKREMNEYDEDTVASNNDDMEDDDTKPAAAVVQQPTKLSSYIDSRQNDFSERSWWMVDIIDDYNSDGNSITQGASPLVKRCMRTHGWNLTKTRKILSAYKQFLMLKKQLEDWDGMLLSPCYLVDLMWHQHILDNVNYYHDMLLLCGHFVGHNPDGGLDIVAKIKRDRFTRECLRQSFGSYDTEVWDHVTMDQANDDADASENEEDIDIVYLDEDQPHEDQPNNEHDNDSNEGGNGEQPGDNAGNNVEQVRNEAVENEIMQENNDANQQQPNDDAIGEEENGNEEQPIDNANQQPNEDDINNGNQNQVNVGNAVQNAVQQVAAGNWGGDDGGGGNDGPDLITIRVKDQTGEETMVRVRRTMRMTTLYRSYAHRKGVERDALLFLLDGEPLDEHETADTLDLMDEDRIDLVLKQAGC